MNKRELSGFVGGFIGAAMVFAASAVGAHMANQGRASDESRLSSPAIVVLQIPPIDIEATPDVSPAIPGNLEVSTIRVSPRKACWEETDQDELGNYAGINTYCSRPDPKPVHKVVAVKAVTDPFRGHCYSRPLDQGTVGSSVTVCE